MLQHYLLVALRNLHRHPLYSAINIFGLALGLGTTFLITSYIVHERSYDRFHSKADRVVRVETIFHEGDEAYHTALTPTAIGPVFQEAFPEVERAARIFNIGMFGTSVVSYEELNFEEPGFIYADSSLFELFDIELLEGNPMLALREPNSIVITPERAKKYFGEATALGKVLTLDGKRSFTVTGIAKPLPENSHFHFDLIASFHTLDIASQEIWWSANYYSYLLLDAPQSIHSLQEKIPDFLRDRVPDYFEGNFRVELSLLPLTDIHLYAEGSSEIEPSGNAQNVYIFSIVALLILLIASINYVNLATARSVDRAREVGVRKVVGASRSQIRNQFIGESVLITLLATLLGAAMAVLALPWFNELTDRNLSLNLLDQPMLLLAALALALLTALLAGIWPALVFARFLPITMLRGSFGGSSGGAGMRRVLVVFQFAVSMFLIIATMVVYRQLNLIQEHELGYDREQLLALPMDRQMTDKLDVLKSSFTQSPDVEYVTAASELPVVINGGYGLRSQPEDEGKLVVGLSVERDFVKTLGLEIVAGRDYDENSMRMAAEDSFAFILNEEALRSNGLTAADLGRELELDGRHGYLHGVAKDFHIASLHKKIDPLVMFIGPRDYSYLILRVRTDNTAELLSFLKNTWEREVPHRPFSFSFVDDEYDRLYLREQRAGSIFLSFAFIAGFVAFLGLFGLASYSVVKRSKEIGIRKVLGASVFQLVSLLSSNMLLLVLIAFVIASVGGWLLMDRWLEDFAFRVSIGWLPLAVAGLTGIITAMLSIGIQAWKAARTNPVEVLKDE